MYFCKILEGIQYINIVVLEAKEIYLGVDIRKVSKCIYCIKQLCKAYVKECNLTNAITWKRERKISVINLLGSLKTDRESMIVFFNNKVLRVFCILITLICSKLFVFTTFITHISAIIR